MSNEDFGPVNSPELEPSTCNDIVNPGLLNRSEQLISIQEKELEAQRDKMGSSSSMPSAKRDVEDKVTETVKDAPNANGSKQSVKSRKDNLLPHLTSMQAAVVNGAGNDNDENALNDLGIISNSHSNRRIGSINSIRTSPRIIQGIDSGNSNGDGTTNKGDALPTGMISMSIENEKYTNHMVNRNNTGIMEIPKRCYSDVTLLGNSFEKAAKNNKDASKRSQSERDLPEFANYQERLPYEDKTDRLPEYATYRVAENPFVDQINSSGFEGSAEANKDNYDQTISTPPSRRTGYANKTFHGLPPLPLKECKFDLSVQERTFSAPTLPFVDADGHEHGSCQVKQRPGSSGSQIVADRKKEFASQVRNELIDKKALLLDSKLTPVQKDIDVDGLSNNRRRNSFDTFSTDIEIEENADESEVSEDLGKKPRWHPPWQLKQEIIAHKDSIPVLAIEPRNRWFASGSTDRSMKIWDINNGNCRLTVKVHKAGIRALAFGSTGHRFIFSAADDRQLICTDIEVNKIVAHYPDQSSVIYDMAMYRPAELLVTCGRDKYVKIWDTREKKCVKTMRGHMNTASSVAIIQNSGQIVSGSHDSTMRIWDIGEGRCTQILTGHEKSVRSIYVHPEEPVISSASTERIIHWSMPDGDKIKEITPTDISINCISVNPQGALVAAGSNGVIHLWDWKSGHKFQKIHRTSVYESQEVPICVFSVAFDKSGSRLFVSDASNIIKVYGEAYTRVRRRHGNIEDKETKRDKHSKFPTPDYAFS